MATIKIYDQHKQENGEMELSPAVFEIEPRPEILNFVVRAQMAARRAGSASTKTRGMVSGGGVKPWKQKGSGRARAGSNRSPLWRGGAILFGPQPREYVFKVNRKVRALAMRMALSSKLADKALMVVDELKIDEPKTKLFATIAKDLGLDKALVVIHADDEKLKRASGNLPRIRLITPDQLDVMHILDARQLVLTKDAVPMVEARFEKEGA